MMVVQTPLTNEELGELLGISHATVSRIKSGHRLPSLGVMDKIRELYGWSIDDQTDARNGDTYAIEFNQRVANRAVPASE
jgi:transcriptional regulator with XRE-family HTH domain